MYKEQTSVHFHIIKKSFPFFMGVGGGGAKISDLVGTSMQKFIEKQQRGPRMSLLGLHFNKV